MALRRCKWVIANEMDLEEVERDFFLAGDFFSIVGEDGLRLFGDVVVGTILDSVEEVARMLVSFELDGE